MHLGDWIAVLGFVLGSGIGATILRAVWDTAAELTRMRVAIQQLTDQAKARDSKSDARMGESEARLEHLREHVDASFKQHGDTLNGYVSLFQGGISALERATATLQEWAKAVERRLEALERKS